jgi:cell division protein FtsL
LASLSHAHSTIAEPVVRPRPRTKPRSKPRPKTRARKRTHSRARGGILWIAVSGILLAGVVFVNVAVLRLNLSLDSTNSERTKLRAENAALQSNLSRELASSQIQTRAAKEFGLTYADPSQYGYVNLAK